jgi:sulfite reductase (NADPH) hemoprotein beta-component
VWPADARRVNPQLITRVEAMLARHGLDNQPIVMRMTGCPSGCARPYVAEIAFTRRAPGKYNMYLGGAAHGQRLNRMHLENVDEERILAELDEMLGRYPPERAAGERFGDYVIHAGIVREVVSGRDFNS